MRFAGFCKENFKIANKEKNPMLEMKVWLRDMMGQWSHPTLPPEVKEPFYMSVLKLYILELRIVGAERCSLAPFYALSWYCSLYIQHPVKLEHWYTTPCDIGAFIQGYILLCKVTIAGSQTLYAGFNIPQVVQHTSFCPCEIRQSQIEFWAAYLWLETRANLPRTMNSTPDLDFTPRPGAEHLCRGFLQLD